MDREELAWAAGFFDGEGCFSAQWTNRKAYRYPVLSVGQVGSKRNEPHVIRRFAAALEQCGIVMTQRRKGRTMRRKNCQPVWTYRLFGREKVRMAGAALWPWLSDVKRAQFCRMLKEARFGESR